MKEKDWIEQLIARVRPFDGRHLGETTSRATALDLRSQDYESKTYKPIVKILAAIRSINISSILLQTEVSQQSGLTKMESYHLTKMAAVNFLASKMKQQKLDPGSF